MYYSPKTSTDGLVFHYDTGNTVRSYLGEPTTNLAYAVNPYLNSNSNWWINGGNTVFSDNDTSIPKPVIPNVDTTNLRIFSSTVTQAVPNQHLGSSIITVSPSTTYSFSIYFYFTGTTLQIQPYVRTAVNNDLLAYFGYNGDTNYLKWPRNQWILLKATFTTQANENGIYMISYTGDTLGEKLAYFGYQVEQKSHCTPLVLGTRSATQGLKDLTAKNTINISTVSFDSNAQMTFDGSDDHILTSENIALNGSQTFEVITTISGGPQSPAGIISNHDYANTSNFGLNHISGNRIGISIGYTDNSREYDSKYTTYTATVGTPFHLVMTFDQSSNTVKLYINGVLDSTFVLTKTVKFTSRPVVLGRWDYQYTYYYFNGKIPVAKVYNQALTADQVQRNFNAVKSRFNIA
jgi:hypothetical protein